MSFWAWSLYLQKVTIDSKGGGWNDEETYKDSYDLKARNILIFTLSANLYFSISHWKIAQIIWNAFQLLNEGTKDVKQSKINTLI